MSRQPVLYFRRVTLSERPAESHSLLLVVVEHVARQLQRRRASAPASEEAGLLTARSSHVACCSPRQSSSARAPVWLPLLTKSESEPAPDSDGIRPTRLPSFSPMARAPGRRIAADSSRDLRLPGPASAQSRIRMPFGVVLSCGTQHPDRIPIEYRRPKKKRRFPGLSFNGSDGTRTRDLRRDRPAL
jgi:hypothetical protein